jgi:phosphate transport system permease protein
MDPTLTPQDNGFAPLKRRRFNRWIPTLFLAAASISIVTTFGIVATLVGDAARFFRQVPLREIFSTKLAPLAADPSFGILPLINGTVITSLIAMLVATPVGLTTAIYLGEFASERARRLLKP